MIYKVYAKTDGKNRITAIDSSGFLEDTVGWVQIDEGSGDRYYLAQNNYFDQALTDDRGLYRYALDRGNTPYKRTREEMDADYVPAAPQMSDTERITALEEENRELKEALDLLLSGVTEEGDEADG